MFLALAILLCALGASFVDDTGVWLLVASQCALLFGEIFRGTVSGTGGFIFMSFLFFGVRPLFIIIEEDYSLLKGLFRIFPEFPQIHENVLWATIALIVFKLGSICVSNRNSSEQTLAIANIYTPHEERSLTQAIESPSHRAQLSLISERLAGLLIFYQIATLPLMQYLASGGRALYGSALGAYAYDLPTVMQAGHIFGFIVILERYLQRRGGKELQVAIVSGLVFLFFTWLMREVSMFRGFYIAGVMIIGIAALDRILPRVSLIWLILPILVLQPIFQHLGSTRNLDNQALKEANIVDQAFDNGVVEAYWGFYSSRGDMNIFDTFVAARNSEPTATPYVWSWIYAPLHVIPRTFWSGKPEKGVTQDLRFMYGAPYAPGIAGFFWLDGGSDEWMLISMMALGLVVGLVDRFILRMPNNYLRACLLAIVTVNAMFLTRFFLWQALWQIMYAVVPVMLMQHFLARNNIETKTNSESDKTEETAQNVSSLYT